MPRHSVAVFAIAVWLAPAAAAAAETGKEALLRAKQAAYDANFQNDKDGLRRAIGQFDALGSDAAVGAWARYYAGWTRWALSGSQLIDSDTPGALATLEGSVADLRQAMEALPNDADVRAALAQSLIWIAVADRQRFNELAPEITALRRRALELGPENPRVVLMDAGMIFNAPPQVGGSQEKGLARWREALRLFDQERVSDPMRPDWGRTLAYGWVAQLYLSMNPPRTAEAKEMADKALAMRPDFWYVKTQIVPKLGG